VDVTEAMNLPKVVLHDHLDGGLRPATVLELAAQRGLPMLAQTPEDLATWFFESADSGSLARYLDTFTETVGLMQDADSLRRIAREFVVDMATDGVIYAEARWAPQQHLTGGVSAAGGRPRNKGPQISRNVGNCRRIIRFQVGNAKTATKVNYGEAFRSVRPILLHNLSKKSDNAVSSHFKAVNIENLGTDMAMQTIQDEVICLNNTLHSFSSLATRQRKTKLLVLMRRSNEVMRMGFYPTSNTHKNVLAFTQFTSNFIKTVNLIQRVHNNVRNA